MLSKAAACIATSILVASAASPVSAQQSWPDTLLTTPGTPENVEKGLEVDAYQLGVSAWVWAYPLVRMERVVREYTDVPDPRPETSYRAPLNQLGWARSLANPAAKDMPTANNDTLYLSAVVDLTEPYVLSVPDVDDRYYVVDVFNMWQELEHYVGRRTTGTKAGQFALVPPGWSGEVPANLTRLEVSTDKVWLWGRLRVSPGDDMQAVHALQDGFDLRPLSAVGKQGWTAPEATLPALPEIGDDPLGFMTHLAFSLGQNAVKPVDTALFGQLARIGLTETGFDPSALTEGQVEALKRGLEDAPTVAIAAVSGTSEQRSGWSYVRGLDDFGFNYPLRAAVAGPYLGGQGEREAVYPIRYTDSAGNNLNGKSHYTLDFASQPPNDAFWSLTVYDAETKMLVENPLDRFKLGSDTPGLKVDGDGGLTVTISAEVPEDEANWLPAPTGDFYVILRIYQPRDEVMNGEWQFPEVVKTK